MKYLVTASVVSGDYDGPDETSSVVLQGLEEQFAPDDITLLSVDETKPYSRKYRVRVRVVVGDRTKEEAEDEVAALLDRYDGPITIESVEEVPPTADELHADFDRRTGA